MWKDIKGYEGYYQVSSDGEIRRMLAHGRTRIVKNRLNPKSLYYSVSLSKKCTRKSFAVHRLVAEAFIPNNENKREVNHIDGNKLNNKVSNLEWVTQKENLVHAMEKLNHYPWGKPARQVRCMDIETNETIKEFHSLSEASKFIGKASARQNISLACQGLVNSAYGYKWEYKE